MKIKSDYITNPFRFILYHVYKSVFIVCFLALLEWTTRCRWQGMYYIFSSIVSHVCLHKPDYIMNPFRFILYRVKVSLSYVFYFIRMNNLLEMKGYVLHFFQYIFSFVSAPELRRQANQPLLGCVWQVWFIPLG